MISLISSDSWVIFCYGNLGVIVTFHQHTEHTLAVSSSFVSFLLRSWHSLTVLSEGTWPLSHVCDFLFTTGVCSFTRSLPDASTYPAWDLLGFQKPGFLHQLWKGPAITLQTLPCSSLSPSAKSSGTHVRYASSAPFPDVSPPLFTTSHFFFSWHCLRGNFFLPIFQLYWNSSLLLCLNCILNSEKPLSD